MIYRADYVLPGDGSVIERGEVLIQDREIVAVGCGLAAEYPAERVRDLGRCALLPGFVDAHSHLEPTLSRNANDGLNLWDWLSVLAFRKNSVPHPEAVIASATLGAAELALSGVTCLGDAAHTGAAADAMDRIGLRGIVCKEIFGQSMGADYPAKCAAAMDMVAGMQSRVSERINIGLSPHAVYTSNPEVLRFCAESGLPVAVHLAETWAERLYCVDGTGPIAEWRRQLGYEPMCAGKSPVGLMNDAGLLRSGVSLAHCVDIDQSEIELIGGSGAAIVHCPRSNAFLGAGIAPVRQLIDAGSTVALGTDSAGSCGRLDFFEEMRFALGMARARAKDAGVSTAKDILRMATADGAKALGLGGVTGRLVPGLRADMVAVSLTEMLPGEDLHLAVVSRQPSDVIMTMVDGIEIVSDGRLVSEDIGDLRARLRMALEK